jgi:hypothetical protein
MESLFQRRPYFHSVNSTRKSSLGPDQVWSVLSSQDMIIISQGRNSQVSVLRSQWYSVCVMSANETWKFHLVNCLSFAPLALLLLLGLPFSLSFSITRLLLQFNNQHVLYGFYQYPVPVAGINQPVNVAVSFMWICLFAKFRLF